jgi:opacity protein-like surface antigen
MCEKSGEVMKLKWAFLSSALVLLLGQAGAQAQLARSYGIKLGVVGANEAWSTIPATDIRWGFTADVYAELPYSKYLSADAEIQYTQKGMKYSLPVTTASGPDGSGQYYTFSPRIDYISIPILAKLRLPLPMVTPYLVIGPRFDFLISKKADGFDATINNFDKMDYGLTVGAGVELNSLFPFGLLAEFRYNPNSYDSYNSQYLSVRNRSMDFFVGVRL